MKAFVILALIIVVLAKDCGQFSCACNSESKNRLSFLVKNDQTNKAYSLERTYSFFDSEKCEGNAIYEHISAFTLTFVKTENATNIYTRKLTSNTLKITGEKALTELGCEGVTVGQTLDLLKEEDSVKCTTASFVVPEESAFPMKFEGIVLTNPEQEATKCEVVSVDVCAVIYPKRYVLIPMYILDVAITVAVIVVYAVMGKRGGKTLPITQPAQNDAVKTEAASPSVAETPAEEKKEETVKASEPAEAAEPVIPPSVSNLEDAASQAASSIL